MTGKVFRGLGNLTFVWVGWGKLNRKCQVSNDFFFRASKSLIAINTCLDAMEEFKGRDIALSQVTVFFFFLFHNLCISQLKPRPPDPRDIAGNLTFTQC